jgi:hypothetical protein
MATGPNDYEPASLAEILAQLDRARPGLDYRTRFLATRIFRAQAPRHSPGKHAPWTPALVALAEDIEKTSTTSNSTI